MAGGVAKSGQVKAQVLIPSGVAIAAITPKTTSVRTHYAAPSFF